MTWLDDNADSFRIYAGADWSWFTMRQRLCVAAVATYLLTMAALESRGE